MAAHSRTSSSLRPLVWSVCMLAGAFLVNACGTSEPVQKTQSTRTLRLTALDSISGEPLDSARAVNRTLNDTLRTDSAGLFVMRDVEPALYVFDVSGYGYHSQRHLSLLVEPDDSSTTASATLLPQRLTLDCEGDRPYGWDHLSSQFQENPKQVRIQLTNVFAQDGEVEVQPRVINGLPTSTIFLPDNFGALGHYEVVLFDQNSNIIPYHYKNPPPDEEGRRIYSRGDILPIPPGGEIRKLGANTLVVGDSIDSGRTIYAQVRYTFSTEDTLQATSATTFPDLGLDSLQVPVFDTLRTDGAVRVPDSLVIQRDTSLMSVVGIDTTVTRSGYTLFSTLRDSNAAPTPQAARNLLYVPDSVKQRVRRRDSLRALARADTTVPPIDTAAVQGPRSRLHIVDRTDRLRLDSLITNDELAQSLMGGLPSRDMTADSLLALSETLRDAFLQIPILSKTRVRRGLNTTPDTTERDSVILSAPVSDSLFRMITPDTLASPDTAASLAERNPFIIPEPGARFAPEVDSIPIDSLQLTVSRDADSVATDTVVTDNLSDPPPHTYWFVPDSLSLPGTEVLAVDPSFFRLRARPRVDTTASIDMQSLLPDRVGKREQIALVEYPQQVIRTSAGTYRSRYLEVWKQQQASRLEEEYCQIFPFPLRSNTGQSSMRY